MSKKNAKYLKWVRQQSCMLCGAPADDAHHIKGVGNLSGAGMTAIDEHTIPLCRPCHNRMHMTPELWTEQPLMVLRTQRKAKMEGVL